MTLLQLWLALAATAAVILIAGTKLSKYGDVIADRTGLGGNWIGLVLMATVTSLPELATGISSVTMADAPDIAVGNVLGACVVNLAVLALLEGFYRRGSIYQVVSASHALAAGFGIVMLAIVSIGLLVGELLPALHRWLWVSTWSLPLVYAMAIRAVFVFESASRSEEAPAAQAAEGMTLRAAATRYAIASAFVVMAGLALPFIATRLADAMGWTQSFVGTLLVAITTTLPELTMTLAALRIGAIDMAVGNLLGSNLFNLIILFIDDVLYRPAPLFAAVTSAHAVTAVTGIAMVGALIAALAVRPRARIAGTVGATGIFLIAMYLLNAWIQFHAAS